MYDPLAFGDIKETPLSRRLIRDTISNGAKVVDLRGVEPLSGEIINNTFYTFSYTKQ